MEKHATLFGLGGMDNALLSDEIGSQPGADVDAGVLPSSAAGGVSMSASSDVLFLRTI